MKQASIVLWLLAGIALIFLMVFVGGITRLTNSGLSIVEWHLISEINPFFLDQNQWQKVFEKYQASPEFKVYNAHYTLADFKQIFWWEYIHRMLGRLIGLVFIIPYLFFTLKKWISPYFHKRFLTILFLGGFQGFLGWYMVKSGLVDNPHVSHFRLAAHMITAFLTCSFIYWVLLEYNNQSFKQIDVFSFKMKNAVLSLFIFQLILGAFVAGLDAGKIFNTFPKMGSEWISSVIPFNAQIFSSKAGVQFLHRTNAFVFTMAYMYYALYRKRITKLALSILCLIAFQIILGIVTLLYSVPVYLALGHQIIGFTILLFLVHQRFYEQDLKSE